MLSAFVLAQMLHNSLGQSIHLQYDGAGAPVYLKSRLLQSFLWKTAANGDCLA